MDSYIIILFAKHTMHITNNMKHVTLFMVIAVNAAISAQDAAPPPPPEKLVALKDSYQAAINRATTPITKTYLVELEKLKTEYTKKGDLASAIAVDDELKPLAALQASPPTISERLKVPIPSTLEPSLAEALLGTIWIPEKESKWIANFTFIDDRHVQMTEVTGSSGKYDYTVDSKDTVRFKFTSGTVNTLQFDKKVRKMSFVGKNIEFKKQ